MLPYDVLCMILAHGGVGDYDTPSRTTVSTWASAARDCRSWTAVAWTMLYRHADFTALEDGEPGPWLPLYVRTMRTCPHLHHLLRNLHIATRGPPFPELYGWISSLPKGSLTLLDYSWEGLSSERSDDSFRLFVLQATPVRAIRRLQVCGSYSPTVLVSIITLSRLEELLITIEHAHDLTFHIPAPTPRLKHLDITIHTSSTVPSSNLLRVLTSAPQLEVLIIRVRILDSVAYQSLFGPLRSTSPTLKQFGLYGNLQAWIEFKSPFMDSLIVCSPYLEVVSCHQGTFTHRFFRHFPRTVKVLNIVMPSPATLSDKCRHALIQCLQDVRKRGLALSRVFVWPRREDDILYEIMSAACNASGIAFCSEVLAN